MKKFLCFAMIMMFVLWPGKNIRAQENGENVTVDVTYGQTEARKMLQMINDFRTGSDAWAFNSENEKEIYTDLKPLNYDYELEKIAMQRAVELAINFSHTRPDGSNAWSAYPSSYENAVKGENLAGATKTAKETFEMWQESDEEYDRQDYRRNMLSSKFQFVGIGHVYYNGYDYWVQEFSNKAGNLTETIANDSKMSIPMEISEDQIQGKATFANQTKYQVVSGQAVSVPGVSSEIYLYDNWPWGYLSILENVSWKVKNPEIAEIVNGKLIGKSIGITELMTTVSGKDIKISLTVTPKNVSIKAADAVKRGFVVQWTKDPLVSGYEIRYSLRKDMKSSKNIMLTSHKMTKKKITNLNKKKKYYIQVRSYKNTKYNGETYIIFSNWSERKEVTTKR